MKERMFGPVGYSHDFVLKQSLVVRLQTTLKKPYVEKKFTLELLAVRRHQLVTAQCKINTSIDHRIKKYHIHGNRLKKMS